MEMATAISIIALAVTAVNVLVTLVLTIRRDAGSIRPVLVFIYKDEGWHVENVGNGPALDVIFHRLFNDSPTQSVRLPALGKGSLFCFTFCSPRLKADLCRYLSRR